NKLGPEIAKLKKELKGGTNDAVQSLLNRSNEFKAQQQQAAQDQAAAEAEAHAIMLQLPAIPDPSWPAGKDDTENKVINEWAPPGKKPGPLQSGQLDHLALGTKLGIIDFERGVKIAGSRSYVMRGDGARLYTAVLQFANDIITSRGYEAFV